MYFNIIPASYAEPLVTQVHVNENTVMLVQRGDTIILDKKQALELIAELTKELK